MAVRVAKEEDFKGVHDVFLEVHKFHMDHTDNVFKDIDPISEDEFKEMLSIPECIFLVSDNDGIDGFLNANIGEKIKHSIYHKLYLSLVNSFNIIIDNNEHILLIIAPDIGYDGINC